MLGPGGPHSARPGRCGDGGRARLALPHAEAGELFPLSTWHTARPRPRAVSSRSVAIPGPLVPYVRAGVKREIDSRLATLQGEIETEFDPETYSAALARLYSATALLDEIGLENRSDQADVEVDLKRWARLLLKALEAQYRVAVLRGLQDVAAEDIHLPPQRYVVELGALVSLVRQETCDAGAHGPEMRRRGDG